MRNLENLVVGAGPSGLAISALFSKHKIPYKIIEKEKGVGAAWRTHYDRLHLHTIKSLSHLPLLPYPKEYPRYVPKDLLIQYMENYAKTFGIEPSFEEELLEAKRSTEGLWQVKTNKEEYLVKNLIICTGYNHTPNVPHWEGEDKFQGEILHSKSYRNATPFKGKKVLIVGIGNTGGELAIDLIENGIDTSICVRSPLRVVPRELFGVPMQVTAFLLSKLPLGIADAISQFLLYITTYDLSEYGIQTPTYGSVRQVAEMEKIPLVDIGTVKLIRERKLKVFPAIRKFHEREIEFVNDQKAVCDTVLLCTGFHSNLKKFFPNEDIFTPKGYPKVRGKEYLKGLYFLGFTNHVSGFLRYIGVEAQNILNEIQRGREHG
ncbi:MAG: NAD(P)/FAD-dependent oxidoreductase [Leptospiraceae bacterium]|nr:NAD(P)/FAD-dependent oxidoreductase [Leptospiraceae bacterium]